MNGSAPLPVVRYKDVTGSDVFPFFLFSFFFKKKKLKDASGSGVFPIGVRTSKQRNSQWFLCTNAPVRLVRLHSAARSGALPLLFLKFQFYHSYN
jgi:hypothetical protein